MKKNNSIKHAFHMVEKNIRAYGMLSVTILLSFTFFLCYLMYVDSSYMTNEVEDIFSSNTIIDAMCPEDGDIEKFQLFISSIKDIDDTSYYVWKDAIIKNRPYSDDIITENSLIIMPREVGNIFTDPYNKIYREDGKKIIIERNQAIVPSKEYSRLKKIFRNKKIEIEVPIEVENNSIHYLKLEVIGGYNMSSINSTTIKNDIIVSYETLEGINYKSSNRHVFVYTKYPNRVVEKMRTLDIAGQSTYENKNEAFMYINEKVRLKSIISIVLFVILGINLFSCFKNALSDRKFEIGVKRAIGASAADIIKQFLFEGVIVVFINIIISILLSITIFLGYKFFLLYIMKKKFIIYISKYSILMFFLISFSITVLYSLIFAVNSARVEIIKHLKLE